MSIRNIGKGLGRWGAVCGLLWVGLGLSGCRTQSPDQQFAVVPPALTGESNTNPAGDPATTPASGAAPATTPGADTVGSPSADPALIPGGGPEKEVLHVGSSLTITLLDTPMVIPPFEGKIREDGKITLTENQTFTADGKTPGDLEKEIRARYVTNYFKRMTVVVKQEAATLWYYVDGEVNSHGSRLIYNNRITVLRAITSAGGFTDFAKRTAVLLTRVDGRSYTVNCKKALTNPKLDLEVYPGDKIHVPRKYW